MLPWSTVTDSSRSGSLDRLYLAMGLCGVGFAVFYLVVGWKLIFGGPGDIGVALLVMILLLAQSIPSAGLVARAVQRREGRPWPRSVRAGMVAIAIMLLATGLLVISGALLLIPLGGVVLLMASQLAERNRAWVATWLMASTAIMLVNGLFVAWWLSLT